MRVLTTDGAQEALPWGDELAVSGNHYNRRISGLYLQVKSIVMMNQVKGKMAAVRA